MNAEYDSEVEYDSPREPIRERAGRAFRTRWVQAVLVLFCGCAAIGISALVLKPKREKIADPKFLFCPKCEFETKYAEASLGSECLKCRDEPVGKLEPRATSIKDELTRKSKWRWFHLAAALEGLVTMGLVVFLLKRPHRDPSNIYYVFSCPHCVQRLRFRAVSLGGLGQCSRCKRPVRFPKRENAVLEDDLIREEQQRLEVEHEHEDDED